MASVARGVGRPHPRRAAERALVPRVGPACRRVRESVCPVAGRRRLPGDLERDGFVRALSAEGIPCGGAYHEQYFDGLLDEAIASRGYRRLWGADRLKSYRDSFHELKGNRETCETTVTLPQNVLLADRGDLDHIAAAIRKIQAHASALARNTR